MESHSDRDMRLGYGMARDRAQEFIEKNLINYFSDDGLKRTIIRRYQQFMAGG